MSLLNDALRKKRGERFATREVPEPEWSKPGLIASRRRPWIAVSSGIALLVVGSAVWLYLSSSPGTSGRNRIGSTRGLAIADTDGPRGEQAAGSLPPTRPAVSPSPAASSVTVAAVPATPETPAPGTRTFVEKVGSQPAHQPSATDRDPSRIKDSMPQTPAGTGPVPEVRSPRERLDPEPHALVSNTAQEEPPGDSERFFQRACQFHRRHGLDQAIALYQAALKENPKHAQSRFNLVAAYLETGAYTQAYPMAAELFSEDPTNQQVMLNLAIAHIGCGRHRQALALLDKAAKLPDAPLFEIAFHKAVAFGHLGRLKAALACYRRAEAMRPDDPGLLFNMALVFDQQQQYGAAVDYYLKYLAHVRERDGMRIKQIRRRIRTLQIYGAEEKLKEKVRG